MTAEPNASSVSLDELLGHAAWVRALARSLVQDPSLAEDAVQDTWLAAVKSPPRTGENPRGWLGAVLRNAVRMRGRSAARRAGHEERASAERDDDVDGDALVERVETQRRLAAAVTRLSEPARSTVILRYYEGLSSAEIARRTNVPAGTVRWRLSQALEELRGRLDDDFGGDRAAWIALVLPLAQPSVGAPTTSGPTGADGPVAATASAGFLQGFLAMNLFLKATVAAGIAAVLFAAGLLATTGVSAIREAEPQREQVAFRPLAPSAAEPAAELADEAAPAERTAFAPAPAANPAVQAMAPLLVRLRAVDEDGAPVAGAELRVRHELGLRSEASGERLRTTTADDGTAELALPFEPVGEHPAVILVCDHPDFVPAEVEAGFAERRVVELGDVRLTPAGAIAGVVRGANGAPVEDAWVEWDPASRATSDLDRARISRSVETYHGGPDGARTDADGRFTLERVPAGDVYVWAGTDGALAARSGVVEVRGGMESGGIELALGVLDTGKLITGVVYEPDGSPATDAVLDFEYKRMFGSGSGSRSVENDGTFVLVAEGRRTYDLRARDDDGRFTSVRALGVKPGDHVELRLLAPERLSIALRVAGEPVDDVAALAGLRMAVLNADHTDALARSGEFELDGDRARVTIPSEPYLVTVAADGCELRELGPFDGLAGPREIEVDLATIPGVRGRVLAGGEPVEGATVELYERARGRSIQDGFAVRVEPSALDDKVTAADGAFALDLRESRTVYVRAEADGFAPAELGPFDVDAGRGLAGLSLELTEGGALEGYVVPAAPGLVVGISRADANPRSTRTDARGFYRFEHLTPGPWKVERLAEELSPYGSSSETSSVPFRESDLSFDCVVSEGATTRFDLATAAELEARVTGSLLLDGKGPDGYVASLVRAPERGPSSAIAAVEASAPVRPDGSFEIAVKEPGRYRMSLTRGGGGAAPTFLAALDLAPGDNPWSFASETGALRVTGTGELVGGMVALDLLRAEVNGVLVLVGLARPPADDDADETEAPDEPVVIDGVPAVSGELVRLTLAELMGSGDPRTAGTSGERVTVRAGETVDVRLPE